MVISDSHASHIGRVGVSFFIMGKDFDPIDFSSKTGLTSEFFASKGDVRRNSLGQPNGYIERGFWTLSSRPVIDSKDINEHIRYLLKLLLPHQSLIKEARESIDGETFFDVLWESWYLYAGTGPLIEKDCCIGISLLEAGIGFDIYAIKKSKKRKKE